MMESTPPAPPPAGNPWLALRLLRDFLQAKAEHGRKRIWLGKDARLALRAIRQAKPQPATPPVYVLREAPAESAVSPPALALPLEEKVRRLAEVKARAEASEAARALGSLRNVMVFAVGNPDAQLMFVGEAPGAEEEQQREPFVGPAGQLLTKIIQAMGLERSDVYISNVCKFRPALDQQGTENRKPTPAEMAACLPFVREEIEIIKPRVIVALGATAAEGLMGLAGVAVGRMRGQFHDCRGTPVMITYHPSYLLRKPQLSEKRKLWEDMLLVMERLGMPISEKQRRFFLGRE